MRNASVILGLVSWSTLMDSSEPDTNINNRTAYPSRSSRPDWIHWSVKYRFGSCHQLFVDYDFPFEGELKERYLVIRHLCSLNNTLSHEQIYGPAVLPLLAVYIALVSFDTLEVGDCITTDSRNIDDQMSEAIGDICATCEASRLEVDGEAFDRRIQGGILSDGLGGLLSALFTVVSLTQTC